jgi:hypothetical protein
MAVIRMLAHGLAGELDYFYTDDDVGILANEDIGFRIFRRAVMWLREQGEEPSDLVGHMWNRIERCHAEWFDTPLDPPEFDGRRF